MNEIVCGLGCRGTKREMELEAAVLKLQKERALLLDQLLYDRSRFVFSKMSTASIDGVLDELGITV